MSSRPNGDRGPETLAPKPISGENFVRLADRFIDVANRANKKQAATDIHMAFLYGAARYNAFVARNIREIADDEAFVEEMAGIYKEMLRNHLADPDV
ncbi:hypothetical protein FP2506_17884 [Fulvimarina pelagi HTCC2506]|uniref:DUF3144 domain-containing protein n=1 Tax=Fulvimarina pelagi HTCC2506 TaxID=314231 RepID=Q0G156_9HYPH|nr:DUF3144 domain-containing protein [Fulvimarina pelagi]EAU40783.1 hypothetical protein FP2506_17884 [Fulvimarina pelagi HTCC2506]